MPEPTYLGLGVVAFVSFLIAVVFVVWAVLTALSNG